MEDKHIIELFEKYNTGEITSEEKAILESWYISQAANNKHLISEEDIAKNLELIGKRLPLNYKSVRKISWFTISAAAAILILISIGIYFYTDYTAKSATQYAHINIENSVTPAENKAFLTLADGKKISLTDVGDGELAERSGIRITKTSDGQLVYTVLQQSQTLNPEYNTIETSKGSQYQVILPDGSKVWLNAASSLRYPMSFEAFDKRKVELKGEAYFEVTKDKVRPFLVTTRDQEVEVLGTHFNVMAYSDEDVIKTTLLEGAVKVKKGNDVKILAPGQQAQVSDNWFKLVSDINTGEVIAWKDGFFQFTRSDIKTVMRQVARWYDVEVSYEGPVPVKQLTGKIPRQSNITQLLNMLTYSGINFEIDGENIIVTSKAAPNKTTPNKNQTK